MKGTKDDEKTVSPMFPRLHVNDTEKGGPRPPPRNKMALYEQLSVPTQRFNSGSASGFPLPPNNTGTSVPSQGGRQERMLFSPFSMPSTTAALETAVGMEPLSSTGEPGSFYTCHISNSRNTYVNKFGNEDDCRVPTFVDSGFGSCSNNDERYFESQRLTRLSSNHLGHPTVTPGNSLPKAAAATCNSPVQIQNSHDKHMKRTTAIDLRSRQENLKESVVDKDGSENIVPYPLSREKIGERIEHAHQSPNQENQRSPDDNLQGLHDCNAQLNQDRVQFLQGKDGRVENISSASLEDVQKVHIFRLKTDSCSRAFTGNGHGSPDEPLEDNSGGLFLGRDVDRNDDVSETSMVDSISGLDISPDDVVGVIGKKHFWKARRAIVNQQRLFAVQVFELHRLIKVQRLIAGSPHLLLRDGTYVSKCSLKSSPSKKLPSEYLLKPPQLLLKPRATLKLNDNIECAAENVVGKPPPLPSVTDIVNKGLPGQLTYGQYSGSPSPAPVAADDKLGWCYHPPPGNQWLIPVMSSSEGLVYKPWAGPCPPTTGFMAPVYGSCGPMNLPPAYGIPASHPQGFGLFSGAPFAQTYIPPYNMPVMNPAISASAVEQVNPLAGPRPYRQAEQVVSTGEVNLNMHSRNSCNVSNQKSEGISCLQKFQASKESEIQGSTASSPPERVQGAVTRNGSDGRDALPLFPVAQATQGLHGGNVDKQHARVIRVVPHNPRSAPESAARIFQSIQEERKQ